MPARSRSLTVAVAVPATAAALVAGAVPGLAGTAQARPSARRAAPAARSRGHAAVPGTTGLRVKGATPVGRVTRQHRTIALVLAERHATALHRRLGRTGAAPLTHDAWMARFAPKASAVTRVIAWAGRHGLHAHAAADRSFVRIGGTDAALGKALGVHFARFRRSHGSTYVASVGTARLPARVRRVTTSVVGLSSLDRVGLVRPQHATAHPSAASGSYAYPTDYTPQQLNAVYDAPSGQTGGGQTLAIITAGDVSQPRQDLATFEQTYGLPTVNWNTVQVGSASSDTSGDDEWDLDSQWSTAFAPGVTTLDDYNGASLSDDDILATVDRWVSDDSTRQASFSAGECELLAYAAGFTDGLDAVLAEADAQGQTLFASSGDNGASCSALVGVNGIPAGVPDVEYPASSPYGIGVGGTSLAPAGEISWYAGGGGNSAVEPVPGWQSGVGGSFLGLQRGVPDVALDADPESGYDVVVDGTVEVIGGTSASAPSWQGIWARIEAGNGGDIGFAGPVLYRTEPASAFDDIIAGSNVPYPTTPGWDYTTGRGSADIAALVAHG